MSFKTASNAVLFPWISEIIAIFVTKLPPHKFHLFPIIVSPYYSTKCLLIPLKTKWTEKRRTYF